MALKDKVKEWMNNNEIGGDNPWFDKDNTYYNLTANQIIAVSKYLNSCDGRAVRAGENTLPIQRVSQRSELLAFINWYDEKMYHTSDSKTAEAVIDEYLKADCG